MKRLFFYIKLYFKIIKQDIKSKMSYRADFIISNLAMILMEGAGFIAFWILFQNFPAIAGWRYEEVMFLYSFGILAGVPQQIFFDNNWNLRMTVYSGDFIKYCFRPLNLYFYFISEIVDLKGIGKFIISVTMLCYSWQRLGLEVAPLPILKLLLSLFSASLVIIAMTNASAAACFWIHNSGFFLMSVTQFRDYARYPISVFNKFLKFFFTCVVPIVFVSYYPSMAVLRPDNLHILTVLSPLIGIVLFIASYFFWMRGAAHFEGTGS